jgi:hypothetical protein
LTLASARQSRRDVSVGRDDCGSSQAVAWSSSPATSASTTEQSSSEFRTDGESDDERGETGSRVRYSPPSRRGSADGPGETIEAPNIASPRGYVGFVAERHKLIKIPAFEVRPPHDRVLDGRTFFELTGETVQMAAEKETESIWTCGGCDAPLAVGIQSSQLLSRVLRCGTCRSYNRIESDQRLSPGRSEDRV